MAPPGGITSRSEQAWMQGGRGQPEPAALPAGGCVLGLPGTAPAINQPGLGFLRGLPAPVPRGARGLLLARGPIRCGAGLGVTWPDPAKAHILASTHHSHRIAQPRPV